MWIHTVELKESSVRLAFSPDDIHGDQDNYQIKRDDFSKKFELFVGTDISIKKQCSSKIRVQIETSKLTAVGGFYYDDSKKRQSD